MRSVRRWKAGRAGRPSDLQACVHDVAKPEAEDPYRPAVCDHLVLTLPFGQPTRQELRPVDRPEVVGVGAHLDRHRARDAPAAPRPDVLRRQDPARRGGDLGQSPDTREIETLTTEDRARPDEHVGRVAEGAIALQGRVGASSAGSRRQHQSRDHPGRDNPCQPGTPTAVKLGPQHPDGGHLHAPANP
jgi:hypothetical protein